MSEVKLKMWTHGTEEENCSKYLCQMILAILEFLLDIFHNNFKMPLEEFSLFNSSSASGRIE